MTPGHPDLEPRWFGNSLPARWDPRAKLLALVPLIFATACLSHIQSASVGIFVALAIMATDLSLLRFALGRVVIVLLMLLPFTILLPLMGSGAVATHVAGLPVYADGLEFASLITLRAIGVVMLGVVLLHTARLADTLWAAQSLGLPRSLVQLAMLTLRYLPILGHEYKTTATAAACRAHESRPTALGYRTLANIAAATLVHGHYRAERVWQAMSCRGFSGRLYPTGEHRMTFADLAATIAMWATTAALIGMDRHL